MKCMIVTDFNTSEEGIKKANKLNQELTASGLEVFQVHLDPQDDYIQSLAYFYEIQPEKIYTMDLAGFHLTDKDGEIIFNKLYAQNHHILTKPYTQYGEKLTKRMSYPSTVYPCYENEIPLIKNAFHQIYLCE